MGVTRWATGKARLRGKGCERPALLCLPAWLQPDFLNDFSLQHSRTCGQLVDLLEALRCEHTLLNSILLV